jgi:hypothetical protein
MNANKRVISLVAILVAVVAGCGGARTSSQQPSGDFTNAMLAEVRTAEGQVLLSGKFVAVEEDSETERKATLAPTGIDADAAGEAEVEYCRDRTCDTQEVEFTVTNVQPGLALTFTIDGRQFATVTADKDGRASVERDVPFPGGR